MRGQSASRAKAPDADLQEAYAEWRRSGDRVGWQALVQYVMDLFMALQARERSTSEAVFEVLHERLLDVREQLHDAAPRTLFEVWLTDEKGEPHRQKSIAIHLRMQLRWKFEEIRRDYTASDKSDRQQCYVAWLDTRSERRWLLGGFATPDTHIGVVFTGELASLRWLAVRVLGGSLGKAQAEQGQTLGTETDVPQTVDLAALGSEPSLWYRADILALPWVIDGSIRREFVSALLTGHGRHLRAEPLCQEALELAASHLAPYRLAPVAAVEALIRSRFPAVWRREHTEADLRDGGNGDATPTALDVVQSVGDDPQDLAERSQMQRDLGECIERLPPRLRDTVRLHFVEGLSLTEIAQRFGVHVSTVSRWKDQALLALMECMESKEYACDSGSEDHGE